MDAHSEAPSPTDLAAEAGALTAGLGIITIQFFPFALPLLVLVIGPLAVLAVALLLLALPILLPLWLARRALSALRRRREARPLHPAWGRRAARLTGEPGSSARSARPAPGP